MASILREVLLEADTLLFCFGDEAADGGCGGVWGGLASDDGVEGGAQVALAGLRAFFAVADEAIIYTAPVKRASIGSEDGDFGGDGGAQSMAEAELGVENGGDFIAVTTGVFAGAIRVEIAFSVGDDETHAAFGVVGGDTVNFWGVGVGYGAVVGDKDDGRRFLTRDGKTLRLSRDVGESGFESGRGTTRNAP